METIMLHDPYPSPCVFHRDSTESTLFGCLDRAGPCEAL